MRKLTFFTKLSVVCLLMFFTKSLQASECYHYYTLKTYQLKNVDGKLFLEAIVKDPNKISIVSYSAILLKNISPINASVYSETADGIIIKNDVAYYFLAKNSLDGKSVLIDKIADVKTQNQAPIGLTFFINGVWKRLNYNPYYPTSSQRVKFTLVKNLPKNAKLLRKYFNGPHPIYLLKDNLHVYIFDEDENSINAIENISPNTAKIDTLNENSDEFCI